MSKFIARLATPADSPALATLADECPMGSSIRLTMRRQPDYFAGAGIQAEQPLVLVGEECATGKIVGSFAAGSRRVFLDGGVRDVRYLSDLRLHPDYRRGTLLARGFRYLRDHVFAEGEWAQTMVLDDNRSAREVLSSGRAGLPQYRAAGDYLCFLIPTRQRVRSRREEVHVSMATRGDVAAMSSFYDREASRKSFCPVYRFGELGTGYYRDLHVEDFALARRGDEIVGMSACWNQSAFKQTRVDGYAGALRLLRPAYNVFASLSRVSTALPRPGSYLRSAYASAIHCREDDPVILDALLGHLVPHARGQGADYLVGGLDARNPLCKALGPWRKRLVAGRHYLVGFDQPPQPPDDQYYFECGRI